MESKTVYFEKPGRANTDEVLRVSRERAKELGIKTILVASTTGDTAVKAVETFSGFRVVAVSWCTGLREPDVQPFTKANRKIVESKGGAVHTATLVFAGVDRALRLKFQTMAMAEIVANTLRIFCQGIKVTCEIALMAADGGLVRTDEDVIAIAGTGATERGADTAIVVRPANSHCFFDLRVREILCKPRSW